MGFLIVLVFWGAIAISLYTLFTGKTNLLRWMFLAGIAGVGLVGMLWLISPLWTKIKLKPEDYRGTYVIDRTFYPGRQADWQYNHFRLEVLSSDSVLFYVTEGAKVVAIYRGRVVDPDMQISARIRLDMDSPTHFILASNPTTYRFVWNFRLVFATKKFGNVAFKKGEWEPLEKE